MPMCLKWLYSPTRDPQRLSQTPGRGRSYLGSNLEGRCVLGVFAPPTAQPIILGRCVLGGFAPPVAQPIILRP